MKRYKLTLSYDGTNYSGWQTQKGSVSIQEILQKTLFTFLREKIALTSASRTDAGVHAIGQSAHFSTTITLDPCRFIYTLNALLPKDIRAKNITPVDNTFHARYSALSKRYSYFLNLNHTQMPFQRFYSYHFPYKIDMPCLKEAALLFIGEKDFTSFSNEAHRGAAANKPVKKLFKLDLVEQGTTLRLDFEGDGFLYKMVRNIVGTLLDVACHKLAPSDIEKIFIAKDRKKAGRCAPPHGLFLVEVKYQKEDLIPCPHFPPF